MGVANYYSRRDVREAIVESAKEREAGVKFGEVGFGKRPDVLVYENDVKEFVKKGATSFHISEERWKNPLELKSGMSRNELDKLRKGWDLVIDIDCKFLEFSKICADIVVRALRFNDINELFVKFSGGSGFHIAVPFESFPEEVNGEEVVKLFPEGPRIILEYLKNLIKEPLKKRMLEMSSIEDIKNVVKIENDFDPYSVLGIDSILISSRHMFRAPYSVNEKTNLVSVVVDKNKILEFNLKTAKMENVVIDGNFFRSFKKNEASQLIIQAFDWNIKNKKIEIVKEDKKRNYEMPKIAVGEEYFPPCMNLILKGLKEDGRKRGVFVLINFLKKMNWSYEDIEKILYEWNKKNYEPLREGYIKAQINWFKKQKEVRLPPNCDNKDYYVGMGVCKPDGLCSKIKNPVNYSYRKLSLKSKENIKKKTNK